MPWAHLVAGGAGGMTAAVLTSPLDVLRTRLQSDIYRPNLASTTHPRASASVLNPRSGRLSNTFQILVATSRTEGWQALFKGLGPNLAGVIPASAIKFYTYNHCKSFLTDATNGRGESSWIHVAAAAAAGVTVSTVTNPIWLVKTRLQLDRSSSTVQRRYKNSLDCVTKVLQQEGIQGLYRGISASYLGTIESTIHWVVYEQMKIHIASTEAKSAQKGGTLTGWDSAVIWAGKTVAAGGSKLLAASIAYPHEVVRTRLRQAPKANGLPKYTGLIQCFRLIWIEEGLLAFYGGFTPHILRVVPSTAIIFGVYEYVIGFFEARP